MSVTSASRAPGPALQHLNELLHTEPYSFAFYGLFWCVVLIVVSPVAGVALAVITGTKLLLYYMGWKQPLVDPHGEKYELAVVITGCDSGFGCELAHALIRKGYVVFAGCLSEESMKQFQDQPRAFPIKMDVTNDEEVQKAAVTVSNWIKRTENEDTKKQPRRYLHAVVNNAGVGFGGVIDWLDLSLFQKSMDVNYFGMIRTVKAFLPLLKAQVVAETKPPYDARIINMVSCAGLIAAGGLSPYHGSKFAAEAFSISLRREMKAWGIKVVTVNPSFHSTPLTLSMRDVSMNVWDNLNPKLQEEYGEEFHNQMVRNTVDLPEMVRWKSEIVQMELTRAVELANPPAQIVVGSDGKYAFLFMRHLPVGVQDFLQDITTPTPRPRVLQRKE